MSNLNRAVVIENKTILSGNRKRSVIDSCVVSSGLNDVTTKEISFEPAQEVYITVNSFLLLRSQCPLQMVIDIGQPFETSYFCCLSTLGTITITNVSSCNVDATILYG